MGYGFKMIWVDTATMQTWATGAGALAVACVIYLRTCRDRPHPQLVGQAVRIKFFAVDFDLPVAVWFDKPGPQPAFGVLVYDGALVKSVQGTSRVRAELISHVFDYSVSTCDAGVLLG
jgi:hypothetical protein